MNLLKMLFGKRKQKDVSRQRTPEELEKLTRDSVRMFNEMEDYSEDNLLRALRSAAIKRKQKQEEQGLQQLKKGDGNGKSV